MRLLFLRDRRNVSRVAAFVAREPAGDLRRVLVCDKARKVFDA